MVADGVQRYSQNQKHNLEYVTVVSQKHWVCNYFEPQVKTDDESIS